jgi:curved DNA-binding protein CbpA
MTKLGHKHLQSHYSISDPSCRALNPNLFKNNRDYACRTAKYRLAKKLHPDLNPGNRKAEEEFKNVSVAYDLLADPDKRARFGRGEIDASGAERPQYYRDFAEGGA